jgi:hypothetical protein
MSKTKLIIGVLKTIMFFGGGYMLYKETGSSSVLGVVLMMWANNSDYVKKSDLNQSPIDKDNG